jgi:hypothetical protein
LELSCDTKDFVQSDDPLATRCSSGPTTALQAVRNALNKDVEEEKQPENRIFQRKFVHMNRAFVVTMK